MVVATPSTIIKAHALMQIYSLKTKEIFGWRGLEIRSDIILHLTNPQVILFMVEETVMLILLLDCSFQLYLWDFTPILLQPF
jgi:hypothetical protein